MNAQLLIEADAVARATLTVTEGWSKAIGIARHGAHPLSIDLSDEIGPGIYRVLVAVCRIEPDDDR